MNRKIYILLPVHNRKAITTKFVSLLSKQTYSNYTLLLIDDGSSDGTAESVRSIMPATVVLKGKGDWWWGGSLHQGYKWLKKQNIQDDDVVLIMNDDTEFKEDFLSTGITLLEKKMLLLASAYDIKTNEIKDRGVFYNFEKNVITGVEKNGFVNCLSTRGLFLHATDFIALGGFHPVLLPHYISDYEFTIRAYHKGYKLACSEELKLWFDEATSGVHDEDIKSRKWKKFWKLYLSKRYAGNPFYAINFYFLAFPFPYNFKHAYTQFKEFVKTFIAVSKYNWNNK